MVDIQIADGKILEYVKTFLSNKYFAIIYHRITFMDDKPAKSGLFSGIQQALGVGTDVCAFCRILTLLQPCELPNRVRMLEKCTISRQKIKTKLWGGGSAPSTDPCPIGEGTPPPQTLSPRRLRRLDTRLRRSTCAPHSKILDPPLASSYFPASSSLTVSFPDL